ncbi:hypothetical protein OFR22_01775 [Brachyspira hyodysenteriae]|uniref:hypothetical protein n=1 Tax=Brachyspira hyodysenteriae TaxID=159 RepID=UPI0022CD6A2E|nr:hypothetical protein [Brachyspira hyodysenteriae]MCZ9979070.1 hypothetical protein [Brachyspira hyodysenteriae]MCZ9994106.1 hypothetical protein [Brachyspira hyodysenteriae]MDA0042866.1 hypothetical protein [Brachyspira hyodysenteriae]MDA0057688.1 hypothetical protein [Brachyspira hyodysenteriae]MDA0061124.1 hypothetical protein [Brachyspira hyodysenteriae]
MLTIITDNSLFFIEKPIRIYKADINASLINKYNLIIEDDKKYKFFILSSDCLDTIDRAYTELRDRIIDKNNNNIKTDLVIDFTNYK